MTKRIATIVLLGSIAFPGAALAKPNQNDRSNAAQECREERGTTPESREAFRQRYGTNKNKRNAFGKCVSRRAEDEEAERRSARSQAVEECRAEHPRGQGKPEKGQANAFGKCVSEKARQKRAEADQRDQEQIERRHNAAKQCDEERGETAESRQAFADKYGTNRNKRNAFGKCVSQHARAD
jgi:hypothetical protein